MVQYFEALGDETVNVVNMNRFGENAPGWIVLAVSLGKRLKRAFCEVE